MLNLRDTIWAGTDASYKAALEAEARMKQMPPQHFAPPRAKRTGTKGDAPALAAGMAMDVPDDDEEPFMRIGPVALIPVHGPMVNIDSPMLKMFGMCGYPVLRRAVIAAANDPAITSIVLDVNSGGGAVAGVVETGDLIRRVNAKVKPVTAYTGGNMLSAAYWIGGSAGQVFASREAMVGSIGVIMVHMDLTKQCEMEGMTPTVMRAGKFKGLGNPFEPLGQDAKEQFQQMLDDSYKLFVSHVAACRGVDYATADEKFSQGRVFMGMKAKTVGLVDGISVLDAVIATLRSKKR